MIRSTLLKSRCIAPSTRAFSTTQPAFGRILEAYHTVPKPTESVPDVETFLTKIGRNTVQYAKHFESWEELFTKPSQALKNDGIDETRDRRYILQWRERFRQGISLMEIKRGTKKWGGERRAKENKAVFYGRQRAEQKNAASS